MNSPIEKFDLTTFSNQELFELKRNQKKIPELSIGIEKEIERRKINKEELNRIHSRLDFKYGTTEKALEEPLHAKHKLLILFFPFLTENLFLSYLKKGNLRKSREYWRYFTFGWMFYVLILIGVFFLMRK